MRKILFLLLLLQVGFVQAKSGLLELLSRKSSTAVAGLLALASVSGSVASRVKLKAITRHLIRAKKKAEHIVALREKKPNDTQNGTALLEVLKKEIATIDKELLRWQKIRKGSDVGAIITLPWLMYGFWENWGRRWVQLIDTMLYFRKHPMQQNQPYSGNGAGGPAAPHTPAPPQPAKPITPLNLSLLTDPNEQQAANRYNELLRGLKRLQSASPAEAPKTTLQYLVRAMTNTGAPAPVDKNGYRRYLSPYHPDKLITGAQIQAIAQRQRIDSDEVKKAVDEFNQLATALLNRAFGGGGAVAAVVADDDDGAF